jgi:hypothetical protein
MTNKKAPVGAGAHGSIAAPSLSAESNLKASGKGNPCPICGRSKDGDCRIGAEIVLCHHGSSHHPPEGLRPGDTLPGGDGQQWAFTGESNDSRAATFTMHKPRHPAARMMPLRSKGKTPETPVFETLRFACLPAPTPEPPDHLPHDLRITYSPTQTVVVVVGSDGKRHIPHHTGADGREVKGAGPDPWPLWREAEALEHGPGRWLAEAEGEKCGAWLRAGGLVGVSQPGHDHKPASIEGRYRRLLEAGVAGVLYLADNDKTGERKAQRCAAAAAVVGLPLLVVPAVDVWPGLPEGGSIDDAPGTAAERVAALLAAIPAAVERHQQQPEPSRSEIEQRTYSELLDAMLLATITGNDDELMQLRAETIARFRRTDAQIEAALFKLHTQREVGSKATPEPESLDLSRISGMDWLIEGFFPDNDLTLVWGNGGSGKSTAALAGACAVLRSTGLLDHSQLAPRGDVLFIASDSGAAPLYAAMQDMGMADMPEVQDGPQKRFHVWASDADQGMTAWAADLRGCIRLLEFIKRHQIRLVLIDSCKAVCSGAGLDYTNNQLVTALLTYFKEVICPHAAVVWLNHDGVAKGAHAGAKAWKEIPSMVHSIIREENKDGSLVNNRRLWRVTKSRMGPTREFYYELNQGELKLCPNQEKVSNCLARVVDVLMGAWQLEGQQSLAKADLVERICMAGGPSRKTLENTLSSATRAKHPEVCRAGRGRYKLAPRIADALKGCLLNGKEEDPIPVTDSDFSSSRQVPMGTSGKSENFPVGSNGKSPEPNEGRPSGQVPSQNGCTPFKEVAIPGMELVELIRPSPAGGSGADAFLEDDDPAWGPRPEVA